MDIEQFLDDISGIEDIIYWGELADCVDELCQSWSERGRRLVNDYHNARDQFYASIPGPDEKAGKEEFIMPCITAMYDATLDIELHAYYRGTELARAFAKGDDPLATIPDYDTLIDYCSAQSIALKHQDELNLQLAKLEREIPEANWQMYRAALQFFFKISHTCAGFYLVAGYMVENSLMKYAYKDFQPSDAQTRQLIERILLHN